MKTNKDELELYFEQREQNDESFKEAWKHSKAEEAMIISLIEARNNANLTQSELAKITGIDQGNISKIENGEGNPTLAKLKRIADGLNAELSVRFIPKNTNQ